MKTDYHKFTYKNMSSAKRKALNVGDIWLNRIKCKLCGDIIQSDNQHDFVRCGCGEVAVDGGSWYGRRLANNLDNIEDLSVMFTHPHKT